MSTSPSSNPHSAQDIPQTPYVAPETPSLPSTSAAYAKGPAPAPGTAAAVATSTAPKNCAVCLQLLQTDQPVKQLCCGHMFHAFCIDQWFRTEINCPICKTQVLFPLAQPAVVTATRRDSDQARRRSSADNSAASDDSRPPVAVPLDGTDAQNYGTCRDCQRTFYRDPNTMRPETAAWYRCARCRGDDMFSMVRASCNVQ